jgi:hypothetical protein
MTLVTVNSASAPAPVGSHAPALTVILAGSYDERLPLEIEAIAAA